MTHTANTPASTQHIPASHVIAGDVVLGYVDPTSGGAVYHSDPYAAAPQADKPGCQCPGHESLTDEDRTKPLVVLYDGENWEYACDVLHADDLVIIQKRTGAEGLPATDRAAASCDVLAGLRSL